MTTDYHSPHVFGAPLTSAGVNSPLAELDAQIGRLTQKVNNVLDFGADPTGATESSTAAQAAHDALPATGGTVYFPPGTYMADVNAPLVLVTSSGVSIVGAGRGATTFKYPTNSVNLYLINSTAALNDLYFGHFKIDGNASNNAGMTSAEGLRVVGTCLRVTVDDVGVHDLKGAAGDESLAFNLGNIDQLTVRGCWATDNGGSGIGIHGCTNFVVANCVMGSNGWMGLTVSTAVAVVSTRGTVTGCVANGNTLYGFNFESCDNIALSGLVASFNGRYGYAFAAGGAPTIFAHNITGAGLVAVSNSQTSAGTYAGIAFSGNGANGAHDINLAGVRAYDDQASKTQGYGAIDGSAAVRCTVRGDMRGNLTGEHNMTNSVTNQYRSDRTIFARVHASANTATVSGVTKVIPYDTEDEDSDAYHAPGSNTLLTVPAGLSGTHRAGVIVEMETQAAGVVILELLKDGVVVGRAQSDTLGINHVLTAVSSPMQCAAGSAWTSQVFQNSTLGKNILAQTNYSPVFWIERL